MTKIIFLTQGKQTIVDDDDFEWANQWKWCYLKKGYVGRHVYDPLSRLLYMHREIMKTPSGMYTDHINHDRLDNRKENLRICTQSQNLGNSKIKEDNYSGFKGVTHNSKGSWMARISQKYLGNYGSPEEAAHAYDKAAAEVFGEFAYLNFRDDCVELVYE